ncbi:heavy-metal-associated domain-containing protein [Sphingorhabdus sp. EL138]|uniref:heavy-metal-associated domain-containing protein n=1 Tax=Sphingorhabdus sp. EL138 TaxID=2073156 RepID=UPI0025F49E77|nr:heavy-metal-associated domain-containing protein [Sphingorhabdus sp. EL138]
MTNLPKNWFRIAAIGLPLALVGGGIVVAQIEGPKRGIAPIASAGDFEVTGVSVNVVGDNAFEARKKGWEQAQRIAWAALWRKTHNEVGAGLSDSTLDGITAAIVVEQEQIGPRRYVAKLGVLFDRARAGQLLGVSGVARRSAPLMLLPVTYSAGAPTVFEQRTSWQRSWAKFRTADSTIDYVRPSGAGGESLLLNAGQPERRSRIWWRTILDQFGAADVIIPIARIERQWPGGPVIGRFSARYGPDNKFLGAFTLRTTGSAGIPAMMDQAVMRMDQLFQSALASGRLRADASLVLEPEVVEGEDLESEVEDAAALDETGAPSQEPAAPSLDDVVRSIVPEGQAPSAPQPRP